MRIRLIFFILWVLFVASSIVGFILYQNNGDLQVQLKNKEKLLNDRMIGDSTYLSKTRQYSEVITKYISNCEFTMDGKKISTAELLKIVNRSLNENRLLKDSLIYLQQLCKDQVNISDKYKNAYAQSLDSSFIYKQILSFIKRDYGVEYSVKRTDDKYKFTKETFTKADSALLLFPYYKDRLRHDTSKNNWIITVK